MQKSVTYLKQLHPFEYNWKIKLRQAFVIGLFIAVFLIVFQPFGLSRVHAENKLMIMFGYGAITFLILLFDNILLRLVFPRLFKEEQWKVWKQLLFSCWIIFSIGLGNSAYTNLFFKFNFSG